MEREEEIRALANHLWKKRGGGDGCDIEDWLKAEAIWEEDQRKKIKIWSLLKSRFKRILKTSAIVSAVIFFLGFIPQLLLLLLNIDNPLFNKALSNLVIGGLGAFIICLIVLMFILSISLIIVTILRRRFHHRKIAINREGKKELKTSPTEPPIENYRVRIINIRAITAIGGISGFVYFMYYVGRAYCDGYSAVMGIPTNLMHYEIQDYVYFGAQIETIWITLAFTAILMGFLITWFRQYRINNNPHGNRTVVGILVYMIFYGLALLLFAMYQIFRPDLIVEKAFVVAILTSCIFLFGIIILILFIEPDTFARIRIGKVKRKVFVTIAIITLLIAPYMSGKAWGAFKGQIVRITDFPMVELYTSKELIESIKWVSTDNITFKSEEELYLVGKTSEFVFLKTSINPGNTYILKLSDVLSTKILSSGKNR